MPSISVWIFGEIYIYLIRSLLVFDSALVASVSVIYFSKTWRVKRWKHAVSTLLDF